MTQEEQREIIRSTLGYDQMTREQLHQQLDAAGLGEAAAQIVPMIREGLLIGEDVFDDEGQHIGAILCVPRPPGDYAHG